MKAVGYTDGPLIDFDTDKPVPGPRDLLIEVSAIAVNPVDTKIRSRVKPDGGVPKVLGWDAVGRVVAVGADVKTLRTGDRVWYAGDVSRSGCNAQFQCVDERIVALAPETLSDAEAAALPLTTITAWEMLFDRLQIPASDEGRDRVLLIVGASGGVGSMLIQLARQLTEATIVATASRPESKAWVERLGAHHVLDHSQPLQPQLAGTGLADITDAACVNRTGEHYADIVAMMRAQGRLCLIDDPAEPLDIKLMKQKSLSLHWEFMFTRAIFQTSDMSAQQTLLSQVAQLIDKGSLQSTLGEHFGVINAANLERAHAAMKTEHTIGKVVLEGFDA